MKQKTIRKCSWALFYGACMIFLLSILLAVFAEEVSRNELVEVVIEGLVNRQNDFIVEPQPFELTVVGLLMVLVVVIIAACTIKFTMNKPCLVLNTCLILPFFFALFTIGILLSIPDFFAREYVKENCS